MELNPNNPTTKAAHDHWHAIVAVMMVKLGLTDVLINRTDMDKLHALPEAPTVMLHDSAEGLRVKLITRAEAEQLLEMQRVGKTS